MLSEHEDTTKRKAEAEHDEAPPQEGVAGGRTLSRENEKVGYFYQFEFIESHII